MPTGVVVGFRTLVADDAVGVHSRAEYRAQYARYLIVEHAHGNFSGFEQLFERACQIIVVVCKLRLFQLTVGKRSHLNVKSTCCRLPRVVYAAPVADNNSVKAPLSFQNTVEQRVVLTAVYTEPLVVRGHHRPYSTALNRLFKGRKIDFIHGALAHIDVHFKAVGFLVVQKEVFQTAGHTVLLGAADIRNHHLSGQIRVFSHIFKAASVQRCTGYCGTGPQHNVLIAKSKLFAYGIAIERAQVGIPSCRETSERRKGYDRVVGPARFAPSVPIVFGAYTVRSVVHVQLSNAQAGNAGRRKLTLCMDNGNFFAERHSA